MVEKSELLPIVTQALSKYDMAYDVMECDPELADTAAFCEFYKVSPGQSVNTIIVASRKVEPTKYAVCVALATTRLDVNKKVSELMGVKKLSFADAEITKQLTGMMIGGVTAPGISDLPIYIDSAVLQQTEVIMGGGNRSTKLRLNPQELTKLPNTQVIDGLSWLK